LKKEHKIKESENVQPVQTPENGYEPKKVDESFKSKN
jgi:hypothetical protein